LDDVFNDDGASEASGRSTGSGDWASGESRSNVDAKREDAKDAETDNEDKDVSDGVASCEVTPVATRSSSSDSSSSRCAAARRGVAAATEAGSLRKKFEPAAAVNAWRNASCRANRRVTLAASVT
jgi:hypothetical protein